MNDKARNMILGLLGATAGGVLGYFAFSWALQQGYYALMLPGCLIGLGGGLLVKDRSVPRAAICGVFGAALGLFSEWRHAPFIADQSLGYFLTHLHQLHGLTLLMLAAGTAFAAWLSFGKQR
jgi:hypothetical protein